MYKIAKIRYCLIISSLLTVQGLAQVLVEAELSYTKLTDNTINITAIISDTEEYEPVSNLQIEIFTRLDTLRKSIGKAITNNEGVAVLGGVPFSNLLFSFDHKSNITYTVLGNDYKETPNELSLSEVNVTLNFKEIDSVKQIIVTISSWDKDGMLNPIEETEAYLYVPRLFSLLPIGDIYTNDEGKGMMVFPTDLPGDKEGAVTVIAKIEDHEQFGNVEVSNTINWGKPTLSESPGLPRALWSPNAPLWMWITFIILMTGVWFHYGLIVLKLFRIYSRPSNVEDIIYED